MSAADPTSPNCISAVALAHFAGEGATPYFLVEHIRSQEQL